MKLYHSASSPNSRRVRMFVAEKGISIPLHTEERKGNDASIT
jgi:glutathione S-transferase